MAKKKAVAVSEKPLTPNQVRILEAIKTKPKTRNELKEELDMQRGFSKLIGASTLDNEDPDSLEGRGYVTSDRQEKDNGTQGPLVHGITAAGKKALEEAKKAEKEAAKAPKATKKAAKVAAEEPAKKTKKKKSA